MRKLHILLDELLRGSFSLLPRLPLLLLLRLLLLGYSIVFAFLGVPFGSGLSFTKRSRQTRTNGHHGRTRAAEVGGWVPADKSSSVG